MQEFFSLSEEVFMIKMDQNMENGRDTITCVGNYHHGVRRGERKTLFLINLCKIFDKQEKSGLGNINLCGIKTGFSDQEKLQFVIQKQILYIIKQLKLAFMKNLQGQYHQNGVKEGYWIDIDDIIIQTNLVCIKDVIGMEGKLVNGKFNLELRMIISFIKKQTAKYSSQENTKKGKKQGNGTFFSKDLMMHKKNL
ncbi:unnamed protein product [Paramecium sonneborni]|uniref:Uncharacterized protein n=1 Tax=Paramecium sonneborni TaxID=65129 RepID=A0A8S1RRX0_9CILI|nr:unnamed protein product [Paramecium sonneborni]